MTEFLFAGRRINRLQLNIHPDNEASRRIATKAGYTFEGLMRGCWFHRGTFHDLEIWSILRAELGGE
jgi:RimJ/RimL family protein N-acetyltransferase